MPTQLVLEKAPRARDSKIIAVTSDDVEPILEHNKMLRSQPQTSDSGAACRVDPECDSGEVAQPGARARQRRDAVVQRRVQSADQEEAQRPGMGVSKDG
jgi:hypothetical protein